MARARSSMAGRRSSASTCGSTPITSTIATGARTTSRPGSITSSTGNTSPNSSAESKDGRDALPTESGGRRDAGSIFQIERRIGADVDVFGVHGLPVVERSVQIDLAVLAARNARRRFLAGLERAGDFLPPQKAALRHLQFDEA